MPDVLRAYGDTLQREQDRVFVVFLIIAGIVLVPLVIVTIGALTQGIAKGWRRRREARRPSPGTPNQRTASSTP